MNEQCWEWHWLSSTWESAEGIHNTVAFCVLRNNGNSIVSPPLGGVMEQQINCAKPQLNIQNPQGKSPLNRYSYFAYRLGRKRETQGLLLLLLFLNTYKMLRYYVDRGNVNTKRKRGMYFFHQIFIPLQQLWGLQPFAALFPIKTSGNVSKLFQKLMEIMQYKI